MFNYMKKKKKWISNWFGKTHFIISSAFYIKNDQNCYNYYCFQLLCQCLYWPPWLKQNCYVLAEEHWKRKISWQIKPTDFMCGELNENPLNYFDLGAFYSRYMQLIGNILVKLAYHEINLITVCSRLRFGLWKSPGGCNKNENTI